MRQAAAFGAALRRERERRGLTLDYIADRTKVAVSLLNGLERGDLTRWPAGIFRRAFVRAYAETIGLDAREVLADFLAIFPDQTEDPMLLPRPAGPEPGGASPAPAGGLRLTLASEPGIARWFRPARVAAAALDTVAASLPAVLAAVAWPGIFWPVLACSALVWYGLGLIVTGTSPASWWLVHRRTVWPWQANWRFVKSGETRAAPALDPVPDPVVPAEPAGPAEHALQRRGATLQRIRQRRHGARERQARGLGEPRAAGR